MDVEVEVRSSMAAEEKAIDKESNSKAKMGRDEEMARKGEQVHSLDCNSDGFALPARSAEQLRRSSGKLSSLSF